MTPDTIERMAKVVVQLGLSTVFAAVLLWWVLTRLSAGLDQVVVEMHTQTQKLSDIQNHVIARDKRIHGYEWQHQAEQAPQHSGPGGPP